MTKQTYFRNPCKTSSIPYWKLIHITIPKNVVVVHNSKFEYNRYTDYIDQKYFRLIHRLKEIKYAMLNDDYYIRTLNLASEIDNLVRMINDSYHDIKVDQAQVLSWTKSPVFDSYLWIGAFEKNGDKMIGSGIAEIDNQMKEGILEWIQILPTHQGKGIGKSIVNELLNRMRNKVKFVTVSGRLDNPSNPMELYKHCCFTGNDIWHVLTKKE